MECACSSGLTVSLWARPFPSVSSVGGSQPCAFQPQSSPFYFTSHHGHGSLHDDRFDICLKTEAPLFKNHSFLNENIFKLLI